MGIVCVKVRICNLDRSKCIDTEAIVDTGSTLTVIPKSIARDLELKVNRIDRVLTGSGVINVEVSAAIIEIMGKETINDVWISENVDRVLIGAVTLECLGLRVDPITGRLVETFQMLYLSTLTQVSTGTEDLIYKSV